MTKFKGQFFGFRGGPRQYRHYVIEAIGKVILMLGLALFARYPAAQTQIASVFAMANSAITIMNGGCAGGGWGGGLDGGGAWVLL